MNALAELRKRARPAANLANLANRHPATATDSQDSQDSQGGESETEIVGTSASTHPDPAVRVDIRADLLALADRLAVDRAHVHRLDDDGLALLAAIGEGGMRSFLLAADDAATRQAGKVPLDDTTAIYCMHCGPVFVHPGIAEVLPVVAGWPRAAGCPWCAIRKAGGYVPRPRIACESCASFKPDTINPAAGVGTCASGHGTHYPMQRHGCGSYNPDNEVTP